MQTDLQIKGIEEIIDISEFKTFLDSLARMLAVHIALLDNDFRCVASSEPPPYCQEDTEKMDYDGCIYTRKQGDILGNSCEISKTISIPIKVRGYQMGSIGICAFHDEAIRIQILDTAKKKAKEMGSGELSEVPPSVREFSLKSNREIVQLTELLKSLEPIWQYIGEMGYRIHNLASGLVNLQNSLTNIFEMATGLARFADTDTLLEQFLEKSIASLDTQAGFLRIWDVESCEVEIEKFRNVDEDEAEFILSVLNLILPSRGNTIYSGQILNDIAGENYPATFRDKGIKKILSVPLRTSNNLIGIMILLDKEQSRPIFTHVDKEKLSLHAILAATAAEIMIQMKPIVRIQEIQKYLLPPPPTDFHNLDIGARSFPKGLVTGDFYHFHRIDEKSLGFAIGDATGKGIPASLQMAATITSLGVLTDYGLRISTILTRLNDSFCQYYPSECTMSLFYGVLSVVSSEVMTLNYVSAAHPDQILCCNNGKTKYLPSTGPLIGFPRTLNIDYEEDFAIMQENDVLILYTDGVTDAQNANNESFGRKELEKAIIENIGLDAQGLADEIYKQIKIFSEGVPQFDDIAIVVIKLKKQNKEMAGGDGEGI